MPVSLVPNVSRRHWIRRSLSGVLGAAWFTTRADAAGTEGEMWALLSDTHIDADPAKEARGAVMTLNLQRTIKQVLSAGLKPHGVLVNGDCAFVEGLAGDYAQFMRCMAPLAEERVQLHCTLGNHDDRKEFRAAASQPGVEPLLVDKHVTILSSARLNWVLLDSLDQVNSTPGLLGASQLGWLRRTLEMIPDKPTLVMLHHNPQPTPGPNGKVSGLTDTAELFEVLRGAPKVKALVFGHSHTWASRAPADGLPWMVNLPPVAYVFHEAHPSGWVMAQATESELVLELRALNPDHAKHKERVVIPLA